MAEKARTPMSGAEREAKYAAKMKEKDYETWCAKNREKMRKCIRSMSEQKRKEIRRRDAERKREKRAAEKLKRNGADACPGIQFIHVSKTEVEESMGDLDDLAFSGARHLPGIRNVHHMEVC